MEKFRSFGDAATGIHPFTFVIAPTVAGKALATVMFPLRMLLCSVFVLLLTLTDTLLWLCYVAYLGVLGRLCLAPLQRVWLRALLFFVGHIRPERSVPLSGHGASAQPDGRSVGAGDLIVCNWQSVWDTLVLDVMLAHPFHVVCVPDATVASAAGSGPTPLSTPGLRVFWPGPLQRWRVWAFTRHTGSLAFLDAQQPGSAPQLRLSKKEAELPLHRVQEAAARAGVPVWWFGEGTCSNGRGLLPMPAIACKTATAPTTAGCTVYVATIQYDSPALQNVLGEDCESVLSCLFRTAVLLYGSTSPASTSPFFPTAEVAFHTVRLARAVPLSSASSASLFSQEANKSESYWSLPAPAVQELRNAMCRQRGDALRVTSTAAAAGRRQPLSVGVKEKKGFVEAYKAMVHTEMK